MVVLRLFLESVHALIVVDIHDAEAVSLFEVDLNCRQRDVRAGVLMLLAASGRNSSCKCGRPTR